jgi:hypothetical protein
MPVRVTLRTKKDFSPFRVLLKRLIELSDGDTVVLCSGYIQDIDRVQSPRAYSLSEDELLDSLKKGCLNGKVLTVAGKLKSYYGTGPSEWELKYASFIRNLRSSGLKVESWSAPEKNWHAKIAIRLKTGTPIAAIVGSSNLTRPAYGIPNSLPPIAMFANWNFEGDVLIWKDSRYNSVFKENIEQVRGIGDMVLTLDPEVKQPDEQEQLWNIYKYVMNEAERFEPLEGHH